MDYSWNHLFEFEDTFQKRAVLYCHLSVILIIPMVCRWTKDAMLAKLTIRTFNNGVIRKRIFPVQFFQLTEYNISYLQDHPIDLNMLDPVVENLSNIPNSSLGNGNYTIRRL